MLNSMKRTVLEEITRASRTSDAGKVLVLSERLRHVESLIQRQQALEEEARVLLEVPTHPLSDQKMSQAVPAEASESARARGGRIRRDFVERLSKLGRRLTQVRGQLYRNQLGEIVGIAYASEVKKDVWFLGLPEGEFQHAVLLCESAERIKAMCLSKDFLSEHGRKLSRSQGQVKFNVLRRAGRYYIALPGSDPVEITELVDNYGRIA